MSAAWVGRVVGQAIDWSLLRVFAAVGEMAERTQPPRYRDEADALNALEDSQDGLEPGDIGPQSPKWLRDMVDVAERWAAETASEYVKCGAGHRYFSGFICTKPYGHLGMHGYAGSFWEEFEATDPDDRFIPQRSAAVSTPAADNTTDKPDALQEALRDANLTVTCRLWMPGDNTTDCGCGSGNHCPDPITCPDTVTAAMDEDTAAADGTDLVDAITQLIDYHQAFTPYVVAAEPQRRVACQGCSWRGADHAEHTRHVAALVADMKNATHRIQEQLGGAS